MTPTGAVVIIALILFILSLLAALFLILGEVERRDK